LRGEIYSSSNPIWIFQKNDRWDQENNCKPSQLRIKFKEQDLWVESKRPIKNIWKMDFVWKDWKNSKLQLELAVHMKKLSANPSDFIKFPFRWSRNISPIKLIKQKSLQVSKTRVLSMCYFFQQSTIFCWKFWMELLKFCHSETAMQTSRNFWMSVMNLFDCGWCLRFLFETSHLLFQQRTLFIIPPRHFIWEPDKISHRNSFLLENEFIDIDTGKRFRIAENQN